MKIQGTRQQCGAFVPLQKRMFYLFVFKEIFFTASVYVEATEVYRPVWLQTSVGKHCWEAAPAFYFLSEKQNAVSH